MGDRAHGGRRALSLVCGTGVFPDAHAAGGWFGDGGEDDGGSRSAGPHASASAAAVRAAVLEELGELEEAAAATHALELATAEHGDGSSDGDEDAIGPPPPDHHIHHTQNTRHTHHTEATEAAADGGGGGASYGRSLAPLAAPLVVVVDRHTGGRRLHGLGALVASLAALRLVERGGGREGRRREDRRRPQRPRAALAEGGGRNASASPSGSRTAAVRVALVAFEDASFLSQARGGGTGARDAEQHFSFITSRARAVQ
jgi:hypothetical protein